MKRFVVLIFFIFSLTLSFSLDETADIEAEYAKLLEMDGEGLTILETYKNSQNIQTITQKDIEKLKASSLTEIFQRALNIVSTNYGGYGSLSSVTMHGMTGGQVLILVDGVPFNNKQGGDADLSTINVNSIEKIEVIRGGSDTKYNYSGAMGGIINIITIKDSFDNRLSVSSRVSNLFYYPDYYYKGGGKTGRVFVEPRDFFDTQKFVGTFQYSNKYLNLATNTEGNIANNSYLYKDSNNITRKIKNNNVWDISNNLSINIKLPQYMKLIVSGSHYYGDKNIYGSVTSPTNGKQKDQIATANVLFDADKVGTDLVDTETSLSYKFTQREWSDISSHSLHNLHTLFFVTRWNVIATNWLNIGFGGDFDYSNLDSVNVGNINYFNGGGYTTFEFNIKDRVLIIPSIKLNYFKDYPVVIPKVGFVFNINDFLTIKNNFYRTFRTPSLNDLYWTEDSFAKGNPDLKPETAFGGDIVLEINKKGILNASGSFYVNYIFDSIHWRVSANKWSPINIGEALYIGTDHMLKSDFSKYVEIFANYSFIWTLILSEGLTIDDNRRIPYIPMHSFSLGVTANWNSGNVTLSGHFESERYLTVTNIEELKPFFRLDISFNQTFLKYFTIFVNQTNCFNSMYEIQKGYPMPGGALLLGLKINYETNFIKGEKKK